MGKRIEWKGGECPVSDDAHVRLWFRNGDSFSSLNSDSWSWLHAHGDLDIIAYEVIEEAKEDKPEKTLWDEYAIAWMSSGDWAGMTPEEAMGECVKVADAMMKARGK